MADNKVISRIYSGDRKRVAELMGQARVLTFHNDNRMKSGLKVHKMERTFDDGSRISVHEYAGRKDIRIFGAPPVVAPIPGVPELPEIDVLCALQANSRWPDVDPIHLGGGLELYNSFSVNADAFSCDMYNCEIYVGNKSAHTIDVYDIDGVLDRTLTVAGYTLLGDIRVDPDLECIWAICDDFPASLVKLALDGTVLNAVSLHIASATRNSAITYDATTLYIGFFMRQPGAFSQLASVNKSSLTVGSTAVPFNRLCDGCVYYNGKIYMSRSSSSNVPRFLATEPPTTDGSQSITLFGDIYNMRVDNEGDYIIALKDTGQLYKYDSSWNWIGVLYATGAPADEYNDGLDMGFENGVIIALNNDTIYVLR